MAFLFLIRNSVIFLRIPTADGVETTKSIEINGLFEIWTSWGAGRDLG